jgi:hypothetical protein
MRSSAGDKTPATRSTDTSSTGGIGLGAGVGVGAGIDAGIGSGAPFSTATSVPINAGEQEKSTNKLTTSNTPDITINFFTGDLPLATLTNIL